MPLEHRFFIPHVEKMGQKGKNIHYIAGNLSVFLTQKNKNSYLMTQPTILMRDTTHSYV